MTDKTEKPEKVLVLQVSPGREELVRSCYETLGYQLEKVKREEHADTQMIFLLEDPALADLAKIQKCRSVLGKLEAIDKRVTYYYLQLVCLVGLIGAVCIGLSFAALRSGQHALFTVLLILGIFGCTVTLYLRPLFTGMSMRKYGGEELALIAELQSLLKNNEGGEKA